MPQKQQAGRPPPAERLWDYALRVYGDAAVASACLQAQDAHGLDVNLLLFAAWCAHEGRRLGAAQIVLAEARCRDWRSEVVEPLRRTRRRWKTVAQRAQDYAAIKGIELDAERRQLSMLAALTDDREFLAACEAAQQTVSADDLLAGNFAAAAAASGVDPAVLTALRQALTPA